MLPHSTQAAELGAYGLPAFNADAMARRTAVGFALFVLANAVLFGRPADVVPSLKDMRMYEVVMLGCIVALLPAILYQLRSEVLGDRPVTLCVVLMLVAVALSHLSHMAVGLAAASSFEFAKVVIYFLLLVAAIDTPQRLRQFILWMVGLIAVMTTLPLLQHHGLINLEALAILEDRGLDRVSGEQIIVPRLRAAGIFHDPNDLAQVLGMGVMLGLYAASSARSALSRVGWVGAVMLFTYAILLTRSRGGLLVLLGGLAVLFHARYGMRKAILLSAVVLPALVFAASGRQAEITTREGTGQSRIRLWSDGLMYLRQSPLFGIGEGQYVEASGQVAHNSFIHCYGELGFFGGTVFLAAFALAGWGLVRMGPGRVRIEDPDMAQLRPYLLAALAAWIVGMLSLSRSYIVPTYLVLGLAAVFPLVTRTFPALPPLRLEGRLLRWLLVLSAATVVATHLFVRLTVRWQ